MTMTMTMTMMIILVLVLRAENLRKYSHDLNAIITVDTHARVRGTQIDTNSWRHGVCVCVVKRWCCGWK